MVGRRVLVDGVICGFSCFLLIEGLKLNIGFFGLSKVFEVYGVDFEINEFWDIH